MLLSTLVLCEETRLLDLPPNEAQSILDQQDLSLKYAPKVDSNVPALRYLGKELHEVLEDIYQARQFHGQDGVLNYTFIKTSPVFLVICYSYICLLVFTFSTVKLIS